jgi:outer membrane protein TolC
MFNLHKWCLLLAGPLLLTSGGCQSYERQPLDLAGHQAAFLARLPESAQVRSFAASLAAPSPGGTTFDPVDGISCPEAEAMAMVFNADLRLARLRAGVTRATADHSGMWEDPTLGVDLVRILQGTPEPWKVFTSVGFTIPISGRLTIEKQRAGIEHAAELARVALQEWSVRMSVRRAWTEWSALDAELQATRDFLSRAQQIIDVVDKMEQAGEMPRTEARLFRIQSATSSADLSLLELRRTEIQLRLHQLMGMSPQAPLRLQTGGMGALTTDPGGRFSQAQDAPSLIERSPALAVVVAEYEAAEKALELEIRRQYPDLNVGPGYGREDGQDQVLLGLSAPLPILNANKQGIAQARARREVARASAETTLEQLIAALHAARTRLAAFSRRRQVFESQIVPMVDAQYADARRIAMLGEVNSLVLLESLTRQQEAKVNLIQVRREEAVAAIELDELIGPADPGTDQAAAAQSDASDHESIGSPATTPAADSPARGAP